MRGGVIQLHRWGLLDAIKAAGTPPVRRTTFHYTEGTTVVDIRPGDGIDALYAPRRTVLDPLLADSAAGSGADRALRVHRAHLLRDEDGRVSGVVGTDRLGRTHAHPRPARRRRRRHQLARRRAGRGPGRADRHRRERLPLPLLVRRRGRRLRLGVPARGHCRGRPHQRRPHLCVRRLHAVRVAASGAEMYPDLLAASGDVAERVLAGRPEGRRAGSSADPG